MKKLFALLLAILIFTFAGCGDSENDAQKNNKAKISNNIQSMEVLIDNHVFKITDKLTFADFEKNGFKITSTYKEIANTVLQPSKSIEDMTTESFNIETSDGKLVALSVVNLSGKELPVKECTVHFISSYANDEYDHKYSLPGNISYNTNYKDAVKKWGNPTFDYSGVEDCRMIQYISGGKCTFTANISDDDKIIGYSYMLEDQFIFE